MKPSERDAAAHFIRPDDASQPRYCAFVRVPLLRVRVRRPTDDAFSARNTA
ncbi:hypothetical protein [Caballeronia sp. ATUFL_M2_KS44]|uniref:hypothetical protein n=1 Tax=Caballeronia sp. ATUFL_M2_KS44 TaxID=2921767 RepID=UPI002028F2A2|nr:hypothetical protein [Caballeronia sp. ATUFL_M2_KS44]